MKLSPFSWSKKSVRLHGSLRARKPVQKLGLWGRNVDGTPSLTAATEQCVFTAGTELKHQPRKRRLHVKTQNKTQMRESVSAGRRTITDPAEATLADESVASARKKP